MSSTIEDIIYEVIRLDIREEFDARFTAINKDEKYRYIPLSYKYEMALNMTYCKI